MIRNLEFDIRYVWRLLKKSWGYSLICAGVVALSVGLAVWTYSIAYSQVLKPLGFPGSERWYSVQIAAGGGGPAVPSVDGYTYQELLKRNRSADYLGAFASRAVILSEGQASTTLRGALISPRLLRAAQVPPQRGRTFDDNDGLPGSAPVAVLSFDTWQTYFAGDESIVGKTARIDGAPVQIIGVMPWDFYLFQDFELWQPLHLPELTGPRDSAPIVSPLVALREDQSPESVQSEMNVAIDGANADHPDVFGTQRRVELIPALRMFTHSEAPVVVMLLLMAAAVLVLGCVNISMVFLARMLERRRELALRAALGASRVRLLRQCLLETVLIVIVGLVAGYGLAALGVLWSRGLIDFVTRVFATGRASNAMALRVTDLLVALAAAIAVWLLSTLLPAWRVAKQDAAVALAGSGKGSATVRSGRGAGLLVGLQVLTSCLVLVVCGNVVLAVRAELGKPSGLNTSQVVISTEPTVFGVSYSELSRRLRYWEDVAAAVSNRMPGAEVAFTTAVPTRATRVVASIEGRQGTEQRGTQTVPLAAVSENYFELLGINLRSGRMFDATDNDDSLDVAVVDERMSVRYWPDEDVLGKRVQLDPSGNGPWLTIVGVVSAVAGPPYGSDDGVIYRPLRQAGLSEFRILARLPKGGDESRRALLGAAFDVDRDLPVRNPQTLDDYLAALNAGYISLIPVLIAVATITAVLAASGLFGLISRAVAQRTQEVGVRRAMGASPWRATSMFRWQGLRYLGVAIVGIAAGVMLIPLLSGTIPNILRHVVPVTVGVAALMGSVILAASYLPARRAVDMEPGDALRDE